jgi:hypothetical protein
LILLGSGASLGFAWLLRREECWVNLLFVCWCIAAAVIPHKTGFFNTGNPLVYALYGLAAAGIVWWGIREARPERINLGIAGFAVTVVCFYLSSVFDKGARSGGLIGLGVLLLAGGWLLDRARRHFLTQMALPEAQS